MTIRTFSKLVFLLLATSLFTTAYSQGYQRLYFDNQRNVVNGSACPISSGGFYTAQVFERIQGNTEDDSIGFLITKHDPKGDPSGDSEWSNDFIIPGASYSFDGSVIDCARTKDDTIIVIAVDESSREREGKKFLLKVDPIGGQVASSRVIQDVNTEANTISYTSRSKIISGVRSSYNYFGTHDNGDTVAMHFIQFDSLDQTIASRSFIGFDPDTSNADLFNLSYLDSKQVSMDSSFVVSMAVPEDPTLAAIMTLDTIGRRRAAYLYELDGNVEFDITLNAIVETQDTGYVAVGHCVHNSISNGIVVKLDSSLNVLWAKQLDIEATSLDINQALDVVINRGGQIVVGGKYVKSGFVHGNYTAIFDETGRLTKALKYENENSLALELSTGFNSSIDMDTFSLDGGILFATNGALVPPETLAPMIFRMDGTGGASCEDTLSFASITDIDFTRVELGVFERRAYAEVLELEDVEVNEHMYDVPTLNLGTMIYCPNSDTLHVFNAETAGATSYLWSTGETTPSITVGLGELMAGDSEMVSVIVTIDERICYTLCDTGSVMKYDLPVAEIEPNNARYCLFREVTLQAQNAAANSAPIVGVQWAHDPTLTNRNITVPYEVGTSYTVTITDECGETSMAQYTIGDLEPTPNVIISIDDSSLCVDKLLGLSAEWLGNSAEIDAYEWSTGEDSKDILIDSPGTYAVTLTDVCGHVSSGSIEVGPDEFIIPEVDLDLTKSSLRLLDCAITLTAIPIGGTEPFTYSWNTGESGRSIDVIATANASDTYTVTVTDRCGMTAESSIIVNRDEFDTAIDPFEVVFIDNCESFTLLLEPELEGVNYQWSTGDTTSSITVVDIQEYSVTVTACTDVIQVATVIPSRMQDLAVSISPPGRFNADCEVPFRADVVGNSAPYTYLWSTGSTEETTTIDPVDGVELFVTVTDNCGVTAMASRTVSDLNLSPELMDISISDQVDTSDCNSKILTVNFDPEDAINRLQTIRWSTGETTRSITVDDQELYTVTVTACKDVVLEASVEPSPPNPFEWPNIFFPYSNAIDINETFGPEYEEECLENIDGDYRLEIYNRWGKRVFAADNPEERWSGSLNNQGDRLEEDVYMWQHLQGGNLVTKGHVTLVRNTGN